jgi:hypothetical protein
MLGHGGDTRTVADRPESHHDACYGVPGRHVCADLTDQEVEGHGGRTINVSERLPEILMIAAILCIVMAVLWKRRK